jgi:hypothetical protein
VDQLLVAAELILPIEDRQGQRPGKPEGEHLPAGEQQVEGLHLCYRSEEAEVSP